MAAKGLFWFLLTGKVLFAIKQATLIVPAYYREVDKSETARDRALDLCGEDAALRDAINEMNINPAPKTLPNVGLFFKGFWNFTVKRNPLLILIFIVLLTAIIGFVAYELIVHWQTVEKFIWWSLVATIAIVLINYVPILRKLRIKLTRAMSHLGIRIAHFVKETIIEQEKLEQGQNATSKDAEVEV